MVGLEFGLGLGFGFGLGFGLGFELYIIKRSLCVDRARVGVRVRCLHARLAVSVSASALRSPW